MEHFVSPGVTQAREYTSQKVVFYVTGGKWPGGNLAGGGGSAGGRGKRQGEPPDTLRWNKVYIEIYKMHYLFFLSKSEKQSWLGFTKGVLLFVPH